MFNELNFFEFNIVNSKNCNGPIYIYIVKWFFHTCHMYLNDFIIIENDDDIFGWHNVRII